MGVTRLSLANLLSGLVPTGVTADTGYQLSWATDDQPWRVLRTSAAATSFALVIDRGVAALTAIDLWAAFGCAGSTSGASILGNLLIEGSADNVSYFPIISLEPTSRGDYLGISPPEARRYVRFTLTLKASEKLVVGLLHGGSRTEIPVGFSGSEEESDRGIVVNDDTDGGGTYAAQLRAKREVLQFDFALRLYVDHLALLAIEEATTGVLTPIVFVPNTDEPYFFHGRILNAQHWVRDPGLGYMGHRWQFKESGRSW